MTQTQIAYTNKGCSCPNVTNWIWNEHFHCVSNGVTKQKLYTMTNPQRPLIFSGIPNALVEQEMTPLVNAIRMSVV